MFSRSLMGTILGIPEERISVAAAVERDTPDSCQIGSYNHPHVMAGQGTAGLELMRQVCDDSHDRVSPWGFVFMRVHASTTMSEFQLDSFSRSLTCVRFQKGRVRSVFLCTASST